MSGAEPKRLVVLKFGGSMLEHPEDYARAAHEVADQLDSGNSVLAIVSARRGVTNGLLADASALDESAPSALISQLAATGEMASAFLLAIACQRRGLGTTVLSARDAGLFTAGPPLDAVPVAADVDSIRAAVALHGVAIVPGFLGVDAEHGPTLLGRGGSDLTALFLARELDAAGCRLLKDVDGLYAADPRTPDAEASLRYDEATWAEVARVGGSVVQEKALRFAAEHRVAFEIAHCGLPGTRVGAGPNRVGRPQCA